MPGSEINPKSSSDSVRSNYEKLYSDFDIDIPLKPETAKVKSVEHKAFGTNDIPIKSHNISRNSLSSNTSQAEANQPKTYLFGNLVHSVYRYLKEKISFSKSISRPTNTVRTPVNEIILARAKKQLLILESNLKNQDLPKIDLDINYPRDLITLKELIKTLENKIKIFEDNKPIPGMEEHFNKFQKYYDDFENSLRKLESKHASLKQELTEKINLSPADKVKLEEEYEAPLERLLDRIERNKNTLGDLRQEMHKLTMGYVDELITTFEEKEKALEAAKPQSNEADSLVQLKAEIQKLQDPNSQEPLEGHAELLENLEQESKDIEKLIHNLQTELNLGEKRIQNLHATIPSFVKEDTHEKTINNVRTIENKWLKEKLALQKGITESRVRLEAIKRNMLPENIRLKLANEKLSKMIEIREKELLDFDDQIKSQEGEILKINEELEEIRNSDIPWQEKRTPSLELISIKEQLEKSIADNTAVLRDIVDELGILKAASLTPTAHDLKYLDTESLESKPLMQEIKSYSSIQMSMDGVIENLEAAKAPKEIRDLEGQVRDIDDQIKAQRDLLVNNKKEAGTIEDRLSITMGLKGLVDKKTELLNKLAEKKDELNLDSGSAWRLTMGPARNARNAAKPLLEIKTLEEELNKANSALTELTDLFGSDFDSYEPIEKEERDYALEWKARVEKDLVVLLDVLERHI